MNVQLVTALLTGAFGLGGVLGGATLTSRLSRRADQQRIAAEDQRRWLSDRRQLYAAYLALVVALLTEIERARALLSNDANRRVSDDTLREIAESVTNIYLRCEGEVGQALGEVQFLAEPNVAELAERTLWAIYELNAFIDVTRPPFTDEFFSIFADYAAKVDNLIQTMRNAMREELGIQEPIRMFPRPEDPGAALAELSRLLDNFT
jgi:hypothetical protein